MVFRSLFYILLLFATEAVAWGTLGHDTVALIAQNYVTASTKSWAEGILGSTSATYLGDVATWADSYRSTSAGKFSAGFHYIDAEDSPPSACNVDLNRDCGAGGCIVSAIANYTARVKDSSLSASQRKDALQFIVHFLGDIHQPLHDEALDVGGNTITVKFDGKSTNLHSIWDSAIPEKLIGGYTMSDAQKWAANLTTEINNGIYASSKAGWLGGMSLGDVSGSAMVWARDSNAFVCTEVIPQGGAAITNQELGGAYYNGVIGTVEMQIAKAGYRLAGWLNLIATGSIALKSNSTMVKREPLSYISPAEVNEFSKAKLERRAFGPICH